MSDMGVICDHFTKPKTNNRIMNNFEKKGDLNLIPLLQTDGFIQTICVYKV